MGSGAEASDAPLLPLLVSICSIVDTSMGCSAEAPCGQQSPRANFTGLRQGKLAAVIFPNIRTVNYMKRREDKCVQKERKL